MKSKLYFPYIFSCIGFAFIFSACSHQPEEKTDLFTLKNSGGLTATISGYGPFGQFDCPRQKWENDFYRARVRKRRPSIRNQPIIMAPSLVVMATALLVENLPSGWENLPSTT